MHGSPEMKPLDFVQDTAKNHMHIHIDNEARMSGKLPYDERNRGDGWSPVGGGGGVS